MQDKALRFGKLMRVELHAAEPGPVFYLEHVQERTTVLHDDKATFSQKGLRPVKSGCGPYVYAGLSNDMMFVFGKSFLFVRRFTAY